MFTTSRRVENIRFIHTLKQITRSRASYFQTINQAAIQRLGKPECKFTRIGLYIPHALLLSAGHDTFPLS